MKGQKIVISILGLVLLSALVAGQGQAQGAGPQSPQAPQVALGTAFTYQGQIESSGSPISGNCDFQFSLYDAASDGAQIGAMQTASNLSVTNGLFTVSLDFGSNAFNGEARWLAISARCPAGSGSYILLTPRQALAPAPYALALPGIYTQQNATSPNIVGGYSSNTITAGRVGAVIGGGGDASYPNAVSGNYATVPGGVGNTAAGDYGFAAGRQAHANHAGAFVWADSADADINSSGNDQFIVRANGGVWIGKATANYTPAIDASVLINTSTGAYLSADGTWVDNRRSMTPQQIAMLKWYTAISTTQTIGVGWQPVGIAFDGANMWVVNDLEGTVQVLRARDGLFIATYWVGNHPDFIAFDGLNMWVTQAEANTINVLRASDGYHVMTPTVTTPSGIAFDGTNMWVANSTGNTVSVLRVSDGFHVMTPTVGINPSNIAFDGTNIWVTNHGGNYGTTVSVLRASDGFNVMTPTVGEGPAGIAFDGVNMWVANLGGGFGTTVSVLRASDGALVRTITVGLGPRGLAFDGENMWVTNYSEDTISVLRVTDGSLVKKIPTGDSPWEIAFDGAFMWTTNHWDGTLSKR